MKLLIVFYSRTGTTKHVAEALISLLKCDGEELIDTKKRSGISGFVRSGRDARSKELTILKDPKYDPTLYDVVLLGTPVWGGTMSTPIRTYITTFKPKLTCVAFFCTQGGTENKALFDDMEELCGHEPIAVLAVTEREVKTGEFQNKLQQFIDKLPQ